MYNSYPNSNSNSSSNSVDSVERTINNVLCSDAFRLRVNNIVSENEHWKNMLKNLQMESKIREEIRNQFVNVRGDLQTLQTSIRDETARNIPAQVAHQIQQQMPGYLDQNTRMQTLLANHEAYIKRELEEKATVILQSIVEDPNYHIIHKAYFDAFKAEAATQLENQRLAHDNLQREVRDRVNGEIARIITLEQNIRELKQIIESHSHSQGYWNTFLTIGVVSTVGMVFYLALK